MATIEERIDAAIALGEQSQGAFMCNELAEMLKDEEVANAFYEYMEECAGCGRLWPIDSMEEGKNMDGLLCFYCVEE